MYEIILYNRGKRVKVIKRYATYSNAIKKYRNLLKENMVYFPKKTLWDGSDTDYELVLIAPPKNKSKEYFRNEFGAMVKIVPKGDFTIKQVAEYQIEETFTDKLNNKKIKFKDLIKTLVKKRELTPAVYVLNNKIYIEYFDDENVSLYTLKNCDDARRLFDTLRSFAIINGLVDIIFFQDTSIDNRTRIYDLLQDKYGLTREYMYRLGTR